MRSDRWVEVSPSPFDHEREGLERIKETTPATSDGSRNTLDTTRSSRRSDCTFPRCVPYPCRTEATFWTVSCFPSSNGRRIFCVSMAALETFYIAVSDESDDIAAASFVDNRYLPTSRWGGVLLAARGVMFAEGTHKSGRAFEQCLIVDDIRFVRSALKSKHVRAAAAKFNLDLMRKRQSAYKPSHCRQLAAAALASSTELPSGHSDAKW